MVLSRLFRGIGIVSLVILALVAYLGYRIYAAFAEHGEVEFGWAISDPDSEP